MAKNDPIIDAQPKNAAVLDPKPQNESVMNQKPTMEIVSSEISKLYPQTLGAGMYMGIPPFTYPTEELVQSPFSP